MHISRFLPYLFIFAILNSCIELEISAPSFLDISKEFNVSNFQVTLTVTYNLIGFCIASLIYGPLSEKYGRRPIMLIGNGILILGSIGCVISNSIHVLLISRFIQGCGAATSAVIVSAIIADIYSFEKSQKVYGQMNCIVSVITGLSPVIGGFIKSFLGWRANYGCVTLICIFSWILQYFYLQETKSNLEALKLKFLIHNYKIIIKNKNFLFLSCIPSIFMDHI